MDLQAQIKKVKPNLAQSSIKNYVISLQKLHERIFGNKNIENFKFLEDKTDTFKEYSTIRDKLNNELKTKSTSGEKSEKQKENWITGEEYEDIMNTYKKFFSKNKIFSKDLDKDDLRLLQEYALLKLYQQIPSRNDFATIKIITPREYQKIKGNELVENLLVTDRDKYYFVINSWKTKKNDMDRRRIDVPNDIKKVLKLLIGKHNNLRI